MASVSSDCKMDGPEMRNLQAVLSNPPRYCSAVSRAVAEVGTSSEALCSTLAPFKFPLAAQR